MHKQPQKSPNLNFFEKIFFLSFLQHYNYDNNWGNLWATPTITNRAIERMTKNYVKHTKQAQVMSRKNNKHIIFMCDTENQKNVCVAWPARTLRTMTQLLTFRYKITQHLCWLIFIDNNSFMCFGRSVTFYSFKHANNL